MTSSPYTGPSEQSLGDLVSRLSENLSRLMRQEVELARTEIRQEATTAGKGAGLLAAAGAVGLVVLLLLSLALARALSEVMDLGWAYLVVAAVWAVVCAVLAASGRSTLKRANPTPQRTVTTVKQIPDSLRGHQV